MHLWVVGLGRSGGRLLAVALGSLLVASSGCDLINDTADSLNLPIEFDHSLNANLDIGAATGQAAGQPAPADVTYDLDLPPVPVDLASANSQIAANRNKLRSVEFTSIRVQPTSNSLTSATPPLDVYIGAKGATSVDDGIKIATIPPIPAGSTGVVNATIDAAGQTAAQGHITSLDFTVILSAALDVQAGETVPGGAAALTITLAVKAVVNPTK